MAIILTVNSVLYLVHYAYAQVRVGFVRYNGGHVFFAVCKRTDNISVGQYSGLTTRNGVIELYVFSERVALT